MLAKTPVTQRSPCYSAVSALLINPLPDRSNYSPLCHIHYLTPDQYFTSLFRPDPLPSRELETNTFKVHCCSALLQNLSRELSALRKLNNKQRQVSMFLILLFKLLTQFLFVSFLSISILSLLPFSILSLLPSFSSDQFFVFLRLQVLLHSVSPMAYFFLHSVSHHDIFFLIMLSISL